MTRKHERQIQATEEKVAKLLELNENEKQILSAGMNLAAMIGANKQGDKINKELRKNKRGEF